MPRGRPSTQTTPHAFGQRLRELRRAKGLTQTQLAAALGVSQRTVSVYESGGTWPSIPALLRMARVLETSADQLLGLAVQKGPRGLKVSTTRLWNRFRKFLQLPPADQRTVWQILDTFVARVPDPSGKELPRPARLRPLPDRVRVAQAKLTKLSEHGLQSALKFIEAKLEREREQSRENG